MTDSEVAAILTVTVDWVRCHAAEIPGLQRLGMYYRFHRVPLEEWLGGLDPLMSAEEVAALLKVPPSWVYANAKEIPGRIRLGRYVRFRPSVIRKFLAGPVGACQ
jgi:predicted DNA-binding transcriptional regulator AlpA